MSRRASNSGLGNNVTVTVDGMENSSWKTHKKSRRQRSCHISIELPAASYCDAVLMTHHYCVQSSQLSKDKTHIALSI